MAATAGERRAVYVVMTANGPDLPIENCGHIVGLLKRRNIDAGRASNETLYKALRTLGMFGPKSDRYRPDGAKYWDAICQEHQRSIIAGRKWMLRQLRAAPDAELKAIALTAPGVHIVRKAAVRYAARVDAALSLEDKLVAQKYFRAGACDEAALYIINE